ncbi:type III secretion system inner membrane ring lipoprotein SctJ [Endozoicomonas montiporae]|uniref:Lipoprotein n=1 Tax=Endozoicomonas montiporae CL-33 TaxID=570277 RepID=A0A142BGG9_9GAMM|nr:type III secretion inner membrane ring lipoprotein SctJ [Endozoicomonas montiporae]AMO57845.1 type III secretion protein J [Endozoicomonas montiporae CL-33]
MKYNLLRRLRVLGVLSLSLLLVACKVELYSGLSEKEGNEMLAILLDGKVAAEKTLDKDKNVTLVVATDEVSRSIKLLKSLGYPKEKYSSIGDIFPKDGLISSPTEERARYTYSMSQELSSTLSMIDGVITARVHVVLPQEQDTLSDVNYPSSASVFIKYTPELELAGFIPKVKTLVSNSIEGLSLDKITVSLFPATRINQNSLLTPEKSQSKSTLIIFILLGLVVLILAGAGGAYWWFYMRTPAKAVGEAK